MWVGVFHVCVCVHSCMSAAATVGALYQAACMVGDRLATCLFWDCAVRCIPALILEMEGGGVRDSWTPHGEEGGRDIVVKTVWESSWEGQWGCKASPESFTQYRWCYRAAASPNTMHSPHRRSDTLKPVPQPTLSLLFTMIFSFQM